VSVEPMLIVGRKLAGRALVDVGETRMVLSPMNSSACTTTAYRAPRCSWPCAVRGVGSRKSSPRTTSVATRGGEFGHLLADDAHFLAIRLVTSQGENLCLDGRADSAACCCLSECCSDCLGVAHPLGAQDIKRSRRRVIEPNVK
jgi:hypothetical protein